MPKPFVLTLICCAVGALLLVPAGAPASRAGIAKHKVAVIGAPYLYQSRDLNTQASFKIKHRRITHLQLQIGLHCKPAESHTVGGGDIKRHIKIKSNGRFSARLKLKDAFEHLKVGLKGKAGERLKVGFVKFKLSASGTYGNPDAGISPTHCTAHKKFTARQTS